MGKINRVSDYQLVENYITFSQKSLLKDGSYPPCHPFNHSIISIMEEIKLAENSADDVIYRFSEKVNKLWKLIISESISCLRYFDSREPFLTNEKKIPIAIGVEELSEYYKKYCDFEPMLYGAEKRYRDHTVHAFRCYLLGVDCLFCNDANLLNYIKIGDIEKNGQSCNNYEKLSIWAIISLVHDIGYPLEKTKRIITETKDMMDWFVSNSEIRLDLSFDGIQTTMNDYVVKMISSKMVEKPKAKSEEKKYVSRIQPKFYYKYLKSLNEFHHGIISSIFAYKMLTFFLESDFSLNEDYQFNSEDVRQFYIRREILRAIASHTCDSIYQIDARAFSLILRIIDEAQEWGRKQFNELVTNQKSTYVLEEVTFKPCKQSLLMLITIEEAYKFSNDEKQNRTKIIEKLLHQFSMFSNVFRDGQNSASRNFEFARKVKIYCGKNNFISIELHFPKNKNEEFIIYNTNHGSIKTVWEKEISQKIKEDFRILSEESNRIVIGRKNKSL